jgi:hypothetical protein
VSGERFAQEFSAREALDADWRDVDARGPTIEDQFGHQAARGGAVLEAVTGEAARKQEAADAWYAAQDRVVIWAHVVQARVCTLAEVRLLERWMRCVANSATCAKPAQSTCVS